MNILLASLSRATRLATLVAIASVAAISASVIAQPVLITAPQTLNPGATTITPTAGGAPIPLATADITVSNTTLTINGRHTIQSVALTNNARLSHDSTFSFDYSSGAGTDVVNGLHLIVTNNLTIESGGVVTADGYGYPSGQGPGAGGGDAAVPYAGGGGHGGPGGISASSGGSSRPGGLPYGSATQPVTFGSGGGRSSQGFGGSGGGVIRIVVSGTLTNNGAITASGGSASPTTGGGAGGSIWITAGSLAGNGPIRANGGSVSTDYGGGGGCGAGGRIAIYACTGNYSPSNISVAPGTGFRPGGIGSLVLAINASAQFTQTGYSACAGSSLTIAPQIFGIGPLSYQWQAERAISPNVWESLTDGPIAGFGNVSNSTGPALSIANIAGSSSVSRIRILVTGSCGSTVASDPVTYNVNCVPYTVATPTQNAYVSGTRPLPPPGSGTATLSYQNLDILPGALFGLGSNETLNLNNGTGVLRINQGGIFQSNGTVIGSIFNAGLVIIPITQVLGIQHVFGGVIQLPAFTPVPSPPVQVQPATMLTFTPPPAGPIVINTPAIVTAGTTRWDGQLDVSGSFTQTDTGKLRVFIAGEIRGQTYSLLNVGTTVNLNGELQIALDPHLLGFVPDIGDTFDVIEGAQGITIPADGIVLRTLMTAQGASDLGLSLPIFNSGFAADPNQLVSLPSNLFSYQLINSGHTLRITLTDPICAPLVGPAPISTCISGTASFSVTTAGSGPFTFQWQSQAAGSTTWLPLTDGLFPGLGLVAGAATKTLAISNVDPAAASLAFRCSVTSPCGTTATTPVNLTTNARCSLADVVGTNGGPVVCGDATVDGSDFVAFINSFAIGDVSIDSLADVAGGGANGLEPDGVIDGTDFVAFINAFALGC